VYREPARHAVDFCLIRRDATYHLFHIRGERGVLVRGPADWGTGEDFGHAVSSNMFDWQPCPPVLPVGLPGAWDEAKVYAPDVQEWQGVYYMTYAGLNRHFAQRIGLATSPDLYTWEKAPANPIVTPGAWSDWNEQRPTAGRDPMLLLDPRGERHRLYYTATMRDGRACIGMAASSDLLRWQDCGPTYVEDDRSYSSLQSPYVITHDGRWYLCYSAKSPNPTPSRSAAYQRWAMVYRIAETPEGPWRRPANHVLLDGWCCAAEHPTFDGVTYAFYIVYELVDGLFHRGTISNPRLVSWKADGTLVFGELEHPQTQTQPVDGITTWRNGAGADMQVAFGPEETTIAAPGDSYRVSPHLHNEGGLSVQLALERGSAASLLTRSSPYARTCYLATLDAGRQRLSLARRVGEGSAEIIQEVPALIEPGVLYHLKIVWQGPFMELFLNGELRLSRADYTFNEGYVGFHVRGQARLRALELQTPPRV
jgi:beta-fructofuranosidase